MAKHANMSPVQVQRMWSANDIKPHVIRTFKLSRDKDFEAKSWDVIGLYLNPPVRALVLCCDGRTHKHLKVKRWLAKHPRFHIHFVPATSSCLNLVERFLRYISVEAISEGSFGSVREVTLAIEIHLAQRNLYPKPYRWRARGADILAKI
jgi:hypothetical protein